MANRLETLRDSQKAMPVTISVGIADSESKPAAVNLRTLPDQRGSRI
jgi:hypothetical protein